MNFFKKLFAINKDSAQEDKTNRQFNPEVKAKNEPTGIIRYVLLVTSVPVQLTTAQMSTLVMECLPNFEKQQDGTCKISFIWRTEPMNLIDVPALAIETFGNGIMDANKYVYRRLNIKLKTGEACILVVYDADSK
jgi:hypothetical protein